MVVDNLSTGRLENKESIKPMVTFITPLGSILIGINGKIDEGVDQVFLLAAAVGVKYIIENPLLSLRTNILGTENVLELANKYKAKVSITSTSENYGKSDKVPFHEDDDRLLGPIV